MQGRVQEVEGCLGVGGALTWVMLGHAFLLGIFESVPLYKRFCHSDTHSSCRHHSLVDGSPSHFGRGAVKEYLSPVVCLLRGSAY